MYQVLSVSTILLYLAGSCVIVSANPPNDRCIDSITLTMGEKVNGDNSGANFDYNNQGVCGARSDRRAVWFEINGIGKEVTINLCTNNGKLTDFGVFRACNTQNCLGFPPQQKEITNCDTEESNEFSFLADDGESYYVHVRSDVLFEGEGSNFTIWYTEPTDEPTSTPLIEEVEPSESETVESSSTVESASSRQYGEIATSYDITTPSLISGFIFGLISLI